VGCVLNSASSNISDTSTHMTTTGGLVRWSVHQKSTQLWLTDTWFKLAILRGIVLMCEQSKSTQDCNPKLGFGIWDSTCGVR